jgi:hypothetical protein
MSNSEIVVLCKNCDLVMSYKGVILKNQHLYTCGGCNSRIAVFYKSETPQREYERLRTLEK